MTRAVGWICVSLVVVWVIAHLLYLGPVRDATQKTIAWAFSLAAASAVVAALAVLAFGLVEAGRQPAWLRFVAGARTAAAVIGAGLVVVGLLHYRDTEPRGDVRWILVGVAALLGAGLIHWWVTRTHRRVG
ncbi:MAG: hypothetical protein ACREM3_17510 [Candidatus Rokuibacteriota bacterium]